MPKLVKTSAVGMAAFVLATTSLASAGTLPRTLQVALDRALVHMSLTDSASKAHTLTDDSAGPRTGKQSPKSGSALRSSATKGSKISELAHTTTAKGVAKGAAICLVASNGKCQAGNHGGNDDVGSSRSGARSTRARSSEAKGEDDHDGAPTTDQGPKDESPSRVTPRKPNDAGAGS